MDHDEVWDDSALIESWNDALAEYKTYHSIHAKGGSVDDLTSSQNQSDRPTPRNRLGAKDETTDGDQSMDLSELEAADETTSAGQSQDAQKTHQEESLDAGRAPAPAGMAGAAGLLAGSGLPGPQMILGSMQDEGLKKLLMSWYYAGYYTGLYEGQQQGTQQSQARHQAPSSDEAQ